LLTGEVAHSVATRARRPIVAPLQPPATAAVPAARIAIAANDPRRRAALVTAPFTATWTTALTGHLCVAMPVPGPVVVALVARLLLRVAAVPRPVLVLLMARGAVAFAVAMRGRRRPFVMPVRRGALEPRTVQPPPALVTMIGPPFLAMPVLGLVVVAFVARLLRRIAAVPLPLLVLVLMARGAVAFAVAMRGRRRPFVMPMRRMALGPQPAQPPAALVTVPLTATETAAVTGSLLMAIPVLCLVVVAVVARLLLCITVVSRPDLMLVVVAPGAVAFAVAMRGRRRPLVMTLRRGALGPWPVQPPVALVTMIGPPFLAMPVLGLVVVAFVARLLRRIAAVPLPLLVLVLMARGAVAFAVAMRGRRRPFVMPMRRAALGPWPVQPPAALVTAPFAQTRTADMPWPIFLAMPVLGLVVVALVARLLLRIAAVPRSVLVLVFMAPGAVAFAVGMRGWRRPFVMPMRCVARGPWPLQPPAALVAVPFGATKTTALTGPLLMAMPVLGPIVVALVARLLLCVAAVPRPVLVLVFMTPRAVAFAVTTRRQRRPLVIAGGRRVLRPLSAQLPPAAVPLVALVVIRPALLAAEAPAVAVAALGLVVLAVVARRRLRRAAMLRARSRRPLAGSAVPGGASLMVAARRRRPRPCGIALRRAPLRRPPCATA